MRARRARRSCAPLADAAYVPDLGALGIGSSYVDATGRVWVRGGVSGSVPVQVSASDPQSGISRNVANVTGAGWRADWTGSSADGALRLTYSAQASAGTVAVSSVNGAGLAGPQTTVSLMRDGSAPPAPTWVTAPSGTTRNIHGSYFRLDWTAPGDSGSGLVGQQVVARYVAGLRADGTCRTNGFTADGGFRLATDRSWDSGLVAGSCYVWSIRSVDNVGNSSPAVISGYVITEPDR